MIKHIGALAVVDCVGRFGTLARSRHKHGVVGRAVERLVGYLQHADARAHRAGREEEKRCDQRRRPAEAATADPRSFPKFPDWSCAHALFLSIAALCGFP
jgi:hypothetical protein